MASGQNLRDLEQLLEQLSHTQQQLQSQFGFMPDLLCVLQPNGTLLLLNSAWSEVMGWEIERHILKDWLLWVHPDDIRYSYAQLQLLTQPDVASCTFRNRMRHGDGSSQTLSWRIRRGEDGLYYAAAELVADTEPVSRQMHHWQQQAAHESWLRMLIQRVHQSLDLSEMLTTTVAEVRQFLRADRVVIYQFLPDWRGEVVVEATSWGCPSILGKVIYDPCLEHLWHLPYLQGQVSMIADRETVSSSCYREMLIDLQVYANLVVPILQRDRLWGLLIAHDCTGPRQWQPTEIDLLQQLATPLAIAIHQSELYQQVQQLNANLEAQVLQRTAQLRQAFEFEAMLKRITEKVRDSLDEHQILQTAVQELAEGLAVQSCDTGIYDLQQQTSTIAHEYVRSDRVVPVQGRVISMADYPELYPTLLQGRWLHFCWRSPECAEKFNIRCIRTYYTALVHPLVDDQDVLGDLWLYRIGDEWFQEDEIRLVQQVATQCAIAIRQARLYHATQAQVIELARLNQLKDDFLCTISHELRTPISHISMATQMLELQLQRLGLLDDATAALPQALDLIKQESQREIELINRLLELSRLEAETEPLVLSTLDPQIWLQHVVEPFLVQIRHHNQQLIVDIPADLPPLTTDFADLERILTELLTNAYKYSPAGETITLSARLLTPSTDLDGPSSETCAETCAETSDTPPRIASSALQLSISNTGVEIPLSEQARIFDKFYRIPNNDPWRYEGTGLGLALVKKWTERLGATIQVNSSAGKIVFTVQLPLQPEPYP
jgi:signal transduction histidine kinase